MLVAVGDCGVSGWCSELGIVVLVAVGATKGGVMVLVINRGNCGVGGW